LIEFNEALEPSNKVTGYYKTSHSGKGYPSPAGKSKSGYKVKGKEALLVPSTPGESTDVDDLPPPDKSGDEIPKIKK
jgi:hypothetical protein